MKDFKKGLSIVELTVYVSLLSVITIVLAASFLPIARSLREFEAAKDIKNSALLSIDSIMREVRIARNINGLSVFDSTPGRLVLDVPDGAGGIIVSDFYVSSSTLMFMKGGVDMGPITGSSVEVSNLVFRFSQSGKAKLVKMEMTLVSLDVTGRSGNFYNSAILRSTEKK